MIKKAGKNTKNRKGTSETVKRPRIVLREDVEYFVRQNALFEYVPKVFEAEGIWRIVDTEEELEELEEFRAEQELIPAPASKSVNRPEPEDMRKQPEKDAPHPDGMILDDEVRDALGGMEYRDAFGPDVDDTVILQIPIPRNWRDFLNHLARDMCPENPREWLSHEMREMVRAEISMLLDGDWDLDWKRAGEYISMYHLQEVSPMPLMTEIRREIKMKEEKT